MRSHVRRKLCQLQFGADQPALPVNGLPSCLLLQEALGTCLDWVPAGCDCDTAGCCSAGDHAQGDDGADELRTKAGSHGLRCEPLARRREARGFDLAERPLRGREQAARPAAASGAGIEAQVLADGLWLPSIHARWHFVLRVKAREPFFVAAWEAKEKARSGSRTKERAQRAFIPMGAVGECAPTQGALPSVKTDFSRERDGVLSFFERPPVADIRFRLKWLTRPPPAPPSFPFALRLPSGEGRKAS